MKLYTNTLFTKEVNRINLTFSAITYAEIDNMWSCPKMLAPFTRVFLVLDGEASVNYNGENIPITPGNIYIFPAGTDFSSLCQNVMKVIFFHVNMLRYNNYEILNSYKKCIILKDKENEIRTVHKLLTKNDVYSALVTKNLALSLFIEAIEQEGIELGKIEEYSPAVKKAIILIDKHLRASLRISELADGIRVSESRLQKDFKREIGIPMGRYINDQLMMKAQTLLKIPEMSVKNVSDKLGFCDQFYFSKRFSQYFGMSPLAYKKTPL